MGPGVQRVSAGATRGDTGSGCVAGERDLVAAGESKRVLGRAANGPGSGPGRRKKEEGAGWELGQNGPAGLVWFSISFTFLFTFLFQTNSNLIEFK